MDIRPQPRKSITTILSTHNQNADGVHALVTSILHMAGCSGCGRLAIFEVALAGDPSPELGKSGVISVETTGF